MHKSNLVLLCYSQINNSLHCNVDVNNSELMQQVAKSKGGLQKLLESFQILETHC